MRSVVRRLLAWFTTPPLISARVFRYDPERDFEGVFGVLMIAPRPDLTPRYRKTYCGAKLVAELGWKRHAAEPRRWLKPAIARVACSSDARVIAEAIAQRAGAS